MALRTISPVRCSRSKPRPSIRWPTVGENRLLAAGQVAHRVGVVDPEQHRAPGIAIGDRAEGVPDQVEVSATPARVGPGETVTLRARIADKKYADVNDAVVTATVTTPKGRLVDVPLEWSLRADGTYTAMLARLAKLDVTRGGGRRSVGARADPDDAIPLDNDRAVHDRWRRDRKDVPRVVAGAIRPLAAFAHARRSPHSGLGLTVF